MPFLESIVARVPRLRRLSVRGRALAAVVAVSLAAGLVTMTLGLWTGLEHGAIDVRFGLRAAVRAGDVVVVGVDDPTFDQLRRPWPFPRKLDARAIDRLRVDGARTIVFDVQFTEATDPADDQALYRAVARAGNVVLATSEVDAAGRTGVLGGDANVAAAHATVGAANLLADGGEVFRRYPYVINHLPSLAVAAAARSGSPISRSAFSGGAAWIDYPGPPRTVREIPFWRLLAGRVPRSWIAGKIVVVGATSPTLGDVHATPVGHGEPMSGPEIQADAIWTALHGNPLRSAPWWAGVLAVLLAAVLVPLMSLRARLLVWGAGITALAGAYVAAAQLLFDHGLIVPVVAPLFTWGVAAFGSVVASYLATYVYGVILEREVQRRTEELRASQREVIRARDEAIEASRLKTAFLANMSHEIRTPMNGVIGMNELLLATALDTEQRGFAEQIARSSEQMMAIVSDILDIAKIEQGTLRLELADFDLHEALRDACAAPAVEARRKGLALDLEIADGVPSCVHGDGARVTQLLRNLVENAVKFTDRGAVGVQAGPASTVGVGRLRFEVRDTGIGIEAESLASVFEPFIQADLTMTRRHGGNGLGLAIARELVERMGGAIGADSEPGRGSTFWVELDLPEAAGLAPAAAGAGEAPEARRASVLLAEEDPVDRELALALLERGGFEVAAVGDGPSALDALAARRFDAVLLGCALPELDGYEVAREIRRREERDGEPAVPIIALAARHAEEDRERCLAAGMDDHVAKPLRAQALHGVLRQWTAGAREQSAEPRAGRAPRSAAPA